MASHDSQRFDPLVPVLNLRRRHESSAPLSMGIARQRPWPGSVTCDARCACDRPRTASPPQFAAL